MIEPFIGLDPIDPGLVLFLAFEVIFVVGVSNKSYGIKVPHQNILLLLTFTLTYLELVEESFNKAFGKRCKCSSTARLLKRVFPSESCTLCS